MRNPHVARLDRQLRLHGEPVQLVRLVAGAQSHRLNVRGVVKTLGILQMIGGVTQTKYLVIVSPTELHRKGYPGAIPATIPAGTGPVWDDSIPVVGTDAIVLRQGQKAIDRVDAIYDGQECVRIEIAVTG